MEFRKGLKFELENKLVKVDARVKVKNVYHLTCTVVYNGVKKVSPLTYFEKDMIRQQGLGNIKIVA